MTSNNISNGNVDNRTEKPVLAAANPPAKEETGRNGAGPATGPGVDVARKDDEGTMLSKLKSGDVIPAVCGAILALRDEQGSSFEQIMNYLRAETVLDDRHTRLVKKALKKSVDDSVLIRSPDGRFKLDVDDVRTIDRIVQSYCRNCSLNGAFKDSSQIIGCCGCKKKKKKKRRPKRKTCKKKRRKRKRSACGPCGRRKKKKKCGRRKRRRPCTRMWVPPKKKCKTGGDSNTIEETQEDYEGTQESSRDNSDDELDVTDAPCAHHRHHHHYRKRNHLD